MRGLGGAEAGGTGHADAAPDTADGASGHPYGVSGAGAGSERVGPVRPGSEAARGTVQAAITAVAVLAALALFVTACGTGGTGARDEGPAHADSVAGAVPSPSTSPVPSPTPEQVNAVRLLKGDPKVSTEVKNELKPCAGDAYPVDVSYGDLTGGAADDVVVNVLTCGDSVGVGSYVYREQSGSYQNVFTSEEPPVYAEIDRGALVVTRQVYDKGDSVTSPSGEEVTTYLWTTDHFKRRYSTRTEWGDADGPTPVPDS